MRNNLLIALILLLFAATPAAAAGSVQLIMLEENGCPWCDKWNEEVGSTYSKTPEGKRAPLRRVDIHRRLPADLHFLNKGRYTPTFILVADGREIGRMRGYISEDFFWGYLGQLLDKITAPKSN